MTRCPCGFGAYVCDACVLIDNRVQHIQRRRVDEAAYSGATVIGRTLQVSFGRMITVGRSVSWSHDAFPGGGRRRTMQSACSDRPMFSRQTAAATTTLLLMAAVRPTNGKFIGGNYSTISRPCLHGD